MIMIIQLTPHRGFSVTDYIKYYAYLYYLLSLDYLFLYFPNYVYPNPTLSTFPVGRNRSARTKPTTFGRALTDSFHMSS
jgi:hypothetical protein